MSSDGHDRRRHARPSSRRPRRVRPRRTMLAALMACAIAVAGLAVPVVSAIAKGDGASVPLIGQLLAQGSTARASGGSASSAVVSATPAAQATANSACSSLYFISAMGSGEAQEAGYKSGDDVPTTGKRALGISPQTEAVYNALTAQLSAEHIKTPVIFYQLPYTAASVAGLVTGVKSPNVLQDWDQLMHNNLPAYIAGEQQGEAKLVGYLTYLYYECYPIGIEPMVVLAGYSQGAMIVHNILNELAGDPNTGYLSLIKGAVLLADPERMPNSDVVNFGSAPIGSYGLCHTLDALLIPHTTTSSSCVAPNVTTDISSNVASIAYQVCNTNDLVCDTSGLFHLTSKAVPTLSNLSSFLVEYRLGTSVHSGPGYKGGTAVTTAAKGVARRLAKDGLGSPSSPPSSSPPSSPPSSPSSSSAPAGSSWTAAEAPVPAGTSGLSLYGVSCVSASQCVAVGNAGDGSGAILTESGGSWTAAEAPLPAGASSPELMGVSCVSASQCVVVGYDRDASGANGELLLTESGGSWTAVQAPLPAGATEGVLMGVSCVSASQCVAVGAADDAASGNVWDLLLTESDGSWTAADAPTGVSTRGQLNGVSCWSASSCVATGTYGDTSVVLTESGGSWTSATAPTADNENSGDVRGVSCVSAAQCVAAGYTADGNGLLLTDSGGSWTGALAPVPDNASGATVELTGISCGSASQCVATGYTPYGAQDGLLLTGSNGSWTAAEAPLPANATTSPSSHFVMGVSCVSATHCVAVGSYSYSDTSEVTDGLILTLG